MIRLYLFLAGLVLGAGFTDYYHKAENAKAELKQARTNAEYNNAITELSNEYYKLYQDASNRKPVTITERVYVKADCAAAAASVDNAGSAGRVALNRESVASVVRVTEEAETLYQKCATQLKAAQAILKKQVEELH